jgi:hypothetical protein
MPPPFPFKDLLLKHLPRQRRDMVMAFASVPKTRVSALVAPSYDKTICRVVMVGRADPSLMKGIGFQNGGQLP